MVGFHAVTVDYKSLYFSCNEGSKLRKMKPVKQIGLVVKC